MIENYRHYARFFRVLSDPNRLMILDMLSCGEFCACVILEKFNITQPTLSCHMKNLCDCGLVSGRKDGKWMHYSLNDAIALDLRAFLDAIKSDKEDCTCREAVRECEC
ncbi:MAG: metalloregulator ArsR/SmtB family transcription factor [Deltaproteobacteria bacterium]|jgi:ArsR family transcriptional regulator|nr:metalloregulator ArsR/SmtB family transcription factor [Deltaproteobacteria bacterium]